MTSSHKIVIINEASLEVLNLKANKVGIWTSYFKNGHPRSNGQIKNNMLIGTWTFYYSNGQKKAEGLFAIGQFELGCIGSQNFIAASVKKGKWNYWYEDGTPQLTCSYALDTDLQEQLTDNYITYYPNGKKQTEGTYIKGARNGIWTYWYPNGQKKAEENYRYKMYTTSDNYLSFEYPKGTWKYWKEDGTLLKTEQYTEGNLVK